MTKLDKNKIYRPAWAEINLNSLAFNFKQVKRIVGPNVKVLVTVKADAYGHGIIAVAKKLVRLGVDYLGVASIEEGILLREAKINSPILILGAVLPQYVKPILDYNFITTVYTKELANSLNRQAQKAHKIAKVHIKVDTGMGRLGVSYEDAAGFIKDIKKFKGFFIEGIFTHFPCADIDADFTNYQIDCFNKLLDRLKKINIHIPIRHAANSMGIVGYKHSHLNLVRPGLMIYGLYPKANLKINSVRKGGVLDPAAGLSNGVNLRPVMSLKAKVVFLKNVRVGCGISYSHAYKTKSDTTIAVLPIGYGDGYPRILSNCADVLIKGRRFRISGNICMDQMMVDIGANSDIAVGDEVVLIGCQGKERITAEELADKARTISYEIVCGIGSRIPRVYM